MCLILALCLLKENIPTVNMDLLRALAHLDFHSTSNRAEGLISKVKSKMPARKRTRDQSGRFASKHNAKRVMRSYVASQRVLETTELLEKILLNLPMKDLLFSQAVCKNWQALSKTSPSIRRALFFEPTADVALSYLDWRLDDKDVYRYTPIGTRLGKPLRGKDGDEAPVLYPPHWGLTREDDGVHRVHVNPLLASKFPILQTNGIFWPKRESEMLQANPSMHHPKASWQHMFFTQPPIETITLECECFADPAGFDGWSIVPFTKKSDAKGLTMHQLWSQLVRLSKPAWILGRDLWESDDEDDRRGLKSTVKARKKKTKAVKRSKNNAQALARRLMAN